LGGIETSLPSLFDHPRIDLVKGDITSGTDLDTALMGIRFVYHLARANVKTWDDYRTLDILPTKLIGERCLRNGVERLVYAGTIASYYAGAHAGTITDETPLDPKIHRREYYARAKAEGEKALRQLHEQEGLPVVILRPGVVLGSGGYPFHWGVGMWPWCSVCLFWGDGKTPLPIVLVEDVADAFVAAGGRDGVVGKSFNLAAEPCITAHDYVNEVERCAGMRITRIPMPIWRFYANDLLKWVVKRVANYPDRRFPSYRDWESRTLRARFDCASARRDLGWDPICDKDEILKRGVHVPVREFLQQRFV
jgi:nucleoside-diphosphate-sugar epimerase